MKFAMKVCAFFARGSVLFLRKIWIFLALLLCVQCGLLYVAVSDVEIPGSLIRRILEPLNAGAFRCSVGEAHLRNLTVLTMKDVRVEVGGDPLIKIRRCSMKLAPEALMDGNFIPRMLNLSGAEIFCPAASSSTGKSELLVSEGYMISRRDEGVIHVDSAGCSAGGARFFVRGELPGTRNFFFPEDERSGSSPSDFFCDEESAAFVSRIAGTASDFLRRAEVAAALDTAFVDIRLFPVSEKTFSAEVSAFLEKADFSEKLSLKKVVAEQDFTLTPSESRVEPSGSFEVFSDEISFVLGEDFSEKRFGSAGRVSVSALLPEKCFEDAISPYERLPREIFVRTDSLRVVDLLEGRADFSSLLAVARPRGSWSLPGEYDFLINISSFASRFSAAGTLLADSENPALTFSCEISPDKEELLALPRLRFLAGYRELASLRFFETPRIRAKTVFSSGMKFEKSDFEFLAGTTFADGLLFRSLRCAGTLAPDSVRLPEILAVGPDFTAHADVFTEFSSDGDFRVRTWGSVDPSYIDGRLGWFWERIWRDLRPAPAEKRPRADIDVRGNWGENWEYVFGAIAGENCWGNGVLVDKVRLRVYEDPLLIAAFDMRFERGNDLVTGNLQWHYAMEPAYHYRDFRFLFQGSIPPKDVLQIIGEGLPEALSEIETDGAGTAVVSGFFSGDEKYYPERLLVSVRGEVPGAFSVFGIRGEDFRGEITYDDGVVLVGGPFTANAGEGSVSGTIRVDLPEDGHSALGAKVEISLDIRGVTRSRLKEALAALGSRVSASEEASPEADPGRESVSSSVASDESEEDEEKTDESSIDAVFAGSLTIPDIDSLDASGKFSMTEPDLFELQIFGGFSRLLSSLKIDLTTFNLDRTEGSCIVRGGKIFLPDLRIFGESGEILVQADVFLPDLKIDGEAVFRNLRGTRIPIFGKIVEWGSASTELLPVKISGTADSPEWTIEPELSRIWSNPEKKFGIAPEKTAEKKESSDGSE